MIGREKVMEGGKHGGGARVWLNEDVILAQMAKKKLDEKKWEKYLLIKM